MEFMLNGMLTEWLEQYPNGDCQMNEAMIAFICREVKSAYNSPSCTISNH